MTLQRKTLWIFVVSGFCMLATLFFAASRTMHGNIENSERDSARSAVRSARGQLSQKVQDFSRRFADWAAWDDSCNFLAGKSPEFIKSNLENESFDVLRINSMVFLDDAMKPVFETGYDLEKHQKTPVPSEIWAALKSPVLTQFDKPDGSHEGLLAAQGRVMIVMLRPIVPSNLKGEIRGTLLAARFLTTAELQELTDAPVISPANRDGLSVGMVRANAALLARAAGDSSPVTEELGDEKLAARDLLADVLGKPSLLLQVVVPRDARKYGQSSLHYLIASLFVASLMFGLVTLLSMRLLVLAPLSRLSEEVRRVRDAGDSKARVAAKGDRELALLADNINGMLAALEQTQTSLHDSIATMEQRSREMTQVGEMGELLQACRTREEAAVVMVRSLGQLFPEESGALCVMKASQDRVEVLLTWGDENLLHTDQYFAPDECWALRRGHPHSAERGDGGLRCGHLAESNNDAYLCLPLAAERQTLGVLHMTSAHSGPWPEAKLQLARTVAEQISLTLFNLELQASLRNQSVRDPLTTLFNRRHMEESLERELSRAQRRSQPVSFVMFDVDHFKRFNDTFGHEAGDLVLVEIAKVLLRKSRKMDIACRFGGEEFLLIMPECPYENAMIRAQELNALVKELTLSHQGKNLGVITLSLGVVTYPDHGQTRETLMRDVDALLYHAKRTGRDRVVGANDEGAPRGEEISAP